MNRYLYEMHLHTAETSPCAFVPAKEIVTLYTEAGYTGVVVTDHLFPEIVDSFADEGWDAVIDYCLSGYKEMKMRAKPTALTVLLGLEIRLRENANDYLLYGATEELLREKSDLIDIPLGELNDWVWANDMLLIQAHPFRHDMTVVPPKNIDGMEIFNGNMRRNSNNDFAEIWAKKHDLIGISSSDFHKEEDLGTGGIYFPEKISTEQELVRALKSRNFYLK